MESDNNNPLNLADDELSDIQRKLSQKKPPEAKRDIYNRITAGPSLASNETPSARGDALNPQGESRETIIKNLRTFQGDMAEAIQNQNASVLTIALAEKKKKDKIPKVKKPIDPELKKNIFYIAVSILLIALGAGSIYSFYVIQKKNAGPIIEVRSRALMGWSKKLSLETEGLRRTSFIERVNTLRETATLSNGEVLYISIEEGGANAGEEMSTGELFALLETGAPSALLRSFGNEFMFGFYRNADVNHPFLLVKLDSFDLAFANMFSWEKIMNDDIGSLFTRRVIQIRETLPPETTATSSATTTPASGTSTAVSQTRIVNFDTPNPDGFEDVVVRNKDARILKNTRGDAILLYSFVNRDLLLITSSESSLRDLVNKLISEQLIR